MFRGDMTEQRKKLMQMLTAAVKGLDRLEAYDAAIERSENAAERTFL